MTYFAECLLVPSLKSLITAHVRLEGKYKDLKLKQQGNKQTNENRC